MKKILLFACLSIYAGIANGQALKSDGTYFNASGTLGYYKSGVVEDKSHNVIGYINADGTVQDKSHATIGYSRKDGALEDKAHVAVAYLQESGNLFDNRHSVINHFNNITEATLGYFFFK